jgi:stalled ribosome rescue protein Dom34
VAAALSGTHEILLAGPGLARNEFRDWCTAHRKDTANAIVDSVATDHPTDAQLVALARQYFKKFDATSTAPTLV